MLEDDVGILTAGQLADLLAEPLPLLRVLLTAVLGPELVALSCPVDHMLSAHRPADVSLLLRRDDADRDRSAIEGVLGCIRAETTGRTPDQHDVALFHVGAVMGHQLAVRR